MFGMLYDKRPLRSIFDLHPPLDYIKASRRWWIALVFHSCLRLRQLKKEIILFSYSSTFIRVEYRSARWGDIFWSYWSRWWLWPSPTKSIPENTTMWMWIRSSKIIVFSPITFGAWWTKDPVLPKAVSWEVSGNGEILMTRIHK